MVNRGWGNPNYVVYSEGVIQDLRPPDLMLAPGFGNPNLIFTSPVPILTSPSISNILATSVTLNVMTTVGAGTLYWIVSTSPLKPTINQIVLGEDATGNPAVASGNQTVSVVGTQSSNATGLAGAPYYAYWAQANTIGIFSTVVGSAQFFTGLAGLVGSVPALFNMVAAPQDFANGIDPHDGVSAAWTFQHASATAAAAIAPDGTLTGQHFTEDNTTNLHGMMPFGAGPLTFQTSEPYGTQIRIAFIAKAAERTRCVAQYQIYQDAGTPEAIVSVGFDLAGGNTNYSNSIGAGWSLLAANMQLLSGGWYLCTVDLDVWGGNSAFLLTIPRLFLDNGSGTAAASTNYAGTAGRGIYLWWFSWLPLGAWSINNLAFFDDFNSISTIDMADTGAPGFNWYLRGQWLNNTTRQNGMNFFGTGIVPATYPAANLSVASSILTDTGVTQLAGRSGVNIMTACPASNAQGYVGTVFGFPCVIEGKARWDPSLQPGNFIIAFQTLGWGSAIEMLAGTMSPPYGPFREFDTMENINNTGPQQTLHQETIAQSPPNPPGVSDIDFTISMITQLSLNINTQNRYAGMVVTTAFNGGSYSLRMAFINGMYCTGTSTVWGPTVHPSDTPSAPIGTYFAQDVQHIPIILSGGCLSPDGIATNPWPIYVDWMKVWQRSGPPPPPHLVMPTVTPSTTSAVIGIFTGSGNGILYWVVTLSSTPPTGAQIKAGQDHTGAPATSSGNQPVTVAGNQSATATGLAIGTFYTEFFYQEDALLQASNIASDTFRTTGGAPILSSPAVTPFTTTANISVVTDIGNGTLWWVVTLSSTQPTAAQIKAGQDHTGAAATSSGNQAVSSSGTQNATASGLTAGTTYTAFFYQESSLAVASNIVSDTFTTNSVTFATWDPATANAGITLSGGNLVAHNAAGTFISARSTIGKTSGKYYWEITITADATSSSMVGLADAGFDNTTYPGNYAKSIGLQFGGARYVNGWTSQAGGTPAFHVGDVVMFAVDFTNGFMWWGVNGSWLTNDPTGTEAFSINGGGGQTVYAVTSPNTATHTANFGQSAFSFSVPAGFNAGLF